MELTQGNLSALYTGLHGELLAAVREAPIPEAVADFVMETVSTKSKEHFPTAATLGDLEELLDEYTELNLGEFMQEIENRDFGRLLNIPRAHIEDDTIGMHKTTLARYGRLAATHPYRRIAQLFILGFTTAWIDGANQWSNSHVWPGGQAWDNLDNVLLNTGGYRLAKLHLRQRIGPDGQMMELNPTHLICGPANEVRARQVLRAQLLGGGDTNIDADSTVEIVVWSALTGTSAYYWFLVDASDVKPIIVLNREPPGLYAQDKPDDEPRWKRERVQYKVHRRYGRAIVAPWVVQAVQQTEDTTTTTAA